MTMTVTRQSKIDAEIKQAAIELAIHLKGMALPYRAENAYYRLCFLIAQTHDKQSIKEIREESLST